MQLVPVLWYHYVAPLTWLRCTNTCLLKSTGRYSERAFCIAGLLELLYCARILSFSKDILIFSSTILTKNAHSLVPLSSPLSPVLYPIYLVWWSRIGDIVVVRLLPYHRKHKLEFSFDFFIHSINCRCWLISQSQLVILSLIWSDLAILLHTPPVPNKVQFFNVQPPPGSAWVISCNAYIMQGYVGH